MTQFLLIFFLPRFSLAFFRGPCLFFPNTEHISISFSNELFLVSHFSKAKKVEGSLSRAPPCVFFSCERDVSAYIRSYGRWAMDHAHTNTGHSSLTHKQFYIFFSTYIPIHFIYTRSHPETRKKVSENANDWNIIFREMAAFVLYGPHTHTPLLHSTGFLKNVENGVQI